MSALVWRDRPQATPADVWLWRTQGCNRTEVAAYLGIDVSTVRGLERQALAGLPVQKLGIPVEPQGQGEAA